MQKLILFFKGFIIGLGKIIPGLSGSILAVSMGVYEKALSCLNLKQAKWQESLSFLIPLGIGIGLAIMGFSQVILFFLEKNEMLTMCFFLGLLLGTLPSLFTNKVGFHKYDLFLIVIIIISLTIVFQKITFPEFTITSNSSYLWIFFLGMVDAFSMIVPGLSGTALFLMLGSYTYILKLFANPFQDILAISCFLIGFIFCFLLMAKLLQYLFKHHERKTWVVIFSFILFSFWELLLQIPFTFNFFLILEGILAILIGFLIIQWLPE